MAKIYSTEDFDINNPKKNTRKANIKFAYTYAELNEYAKCKNDPIYFIEKYCKISTERGLENIVLRNYQKDIIANYFEKRFNIIKQSRQMGITTLMECILMYGITFDNTTFDIFINNLSAGKYFLDSILLIRSGLPFFLQKGIIKSNSREIKFDNEVHIRINPDLRGSSSYEESIKIFLDADHLSKKHIQIYEDCQPSITEKNTSRVLITCRNGSYFSKIFDSAYNIVDDNTKFKNSFYGTKVAWWQVPGRDEEWKKQQIKMLGSEDKFNDEYNI